ncbi:MAG: RsmB/NOP family class I SAM-dependent RNA methyltransferase [Lautropia sp.]|nr:RsmB/NOP family class I SAM-dependent RNA methyltransferase [Lautropia sp.]
MNRRTPVGASAETRLPHGYPGQAQPRVDARLIDMAAEALQVLLPKGAERAQWLFGAPGAHGVAAAAASTSARRPTAALESAVPGLEQGTIAGMSVGRQEGMSAAAECWASGVHEVADWRGMMPADQRLGLWLRRHSSLGSRERRWLSDRVYDVLRHGRAYDVFMQRRAVADDDGLSLKTRLVGLIRLSEACRARRDEQASEGWNAAGVGGATASPDVPRSGQRTRAVPVPDAPVSGGSSDADLYERYRLWLSSQPPQIRYSLPDWLWAGLVQTHGEKAEALAAVLLLPAAIDIRCNLLKGKPAALRARLAEEGMVAEPVEGVPTALRMRGRPALVRSPLFETGWFELQDAGSQMIVDTCGARRGERVVDFCAGAGGKALGLAARMRNQGQMLAFDNDETRLARLEPRLKRAGVSILTRMRLEDSDDARLARYQAWADLVLVDAPCSGSGTFRRHPDLKWRLQPEDVASLCARQREILRAAARLVRPGGRLVYATCSLLAAENERQLDWFGRYSTGGAVRTEAAGGDCDACAAAVPAGGTSGAGAEMDRPALAWADEPSLGVSTSASAQGRPESVPVLQLTSSRYWLPDAGAGDAFFMSVWQAPGGKR